ncbi:hypothetical protein NFI96_000782 [Prochilodus magdalenae]|nr:hypothetical protein NFI96_000782 [Prochilodus magdalenae]
MSATELGNRWNCSLRRRLLVFNFGAEKEKLNRKCNQQTERYCSVCALCVVCTVCMCAPYLSSSYNVTHVSSNSARAECKAEALCQQICKCSPTAGVWQWSGTAAAQLAMEPLSLVVLLVSVGSFLSSQWLFHRGSPWLSERFAPAFNTLSLTQRTEWNSRAVSTVHALVVGLLCLYILLFDEAVRRDPVWGDPTLVKLNVGITTGYLISGEAFTTCSHALACPVGIVASAYRKTQERS